MKPFDSLFKISGTKAQFLRVTGIKEKTLLVCERASVHLPQGILAGSTSIGNDIELPKEALSSWAIWDQEPIVPTGYVCQTAHVDKPAKAQKSYAGDGGLLRFLKDLDAAHLEVNDWEASFIESCLGRSSFPPTQWEVIEKLRARYAVTQG